MGHIFHMISLGVARSQILLYTSALVAKMALKYIYILRVKKNHFNLVVVECTVLSSA